MRHLLLALLCVLPASLLCAAERRPNVLVILADDQGWGDVSGNGNTNVSTPNVDSIGRAGAVLERFFVCPVCSPTRAEFLTGRYHPRGGVHGVSVGHERLNLDEHTIAETFKAAGYATGAFGKWHNGSQWPYHPNARGFQEYYGFTSGHWGEYFDAPLEHNGTFVRGKGYIADDFTDHAIAFIEQNRERPFFCYLPFNTPHSPFCVPDEYWNRFKDKSIAMRGKDGEKEDVQVTRCALAMCENIDMNVGRVLRKLDELKLADNTIVLYFSDNGPASYRWNGGMRGKKGTTDEGGVREPFVIRWPGKIKPGTVVPQIAGAIDLLPTLAKMTGVSIVGDKPLDGKDISPLLFGVAHDWPDRMIFHTFNGRLSVRTQQYRLDDAGNLYDMTVDPGQTRDISSDKPETAKNLRDAVATFRKEVLGSAVPLPAKAKARKAGEMPDDRPFTVGYREFPMTPLPARDGVAHGAVKRSAGAPNCSYFVNWKSTDDSMTWDIDVHTAGDYDAAIYYTCPDADAGSTIELSFKNSRKTATVSPGWNPPLIDKQDRVPRVAESYLKEFHPLGLGVMHLESGRDLLTLRALKIPGASVMDVRGITLTLRPAAAAIKPAPTRADVSFGPHPHQLLDVYIPDGAGPFPVLVWYGGLWQPAKRPPDVRRFLDAHCALVAVEARVMNDAIEAKIFPPVSVCLLDGRRAVQFVRLHASEWNLDPKRIAVGGGSQSALPALFVACSGEGANPESSDPVERVSTKVLAAGAWRSQPSIDPKQMQEWVPGVKWGAPAFGCTFEESLKRREEFLPVITRWSPDALVNKDAPPLYFENNWGLTRPDEVKEADYRVHSPRWALGFQKIAKERGATCYVRFPDHPSEKYADMWDFLLRELGADAVHSR